MAVPPQVDAIVSRVSTKHIVQHFQEVAPPIETVFRGRGQVELRGLCSRRERLKVEVNVIKCHAVKRGVRLAIVVNAK